MQVIQVTDPHLFADADGRLRGVPTRSAFEEVLEHVEERHGDADRLIVTGDLAEDRRRETYDTLRQRLSSWGERARVVPGNHDVPGDVGSAFRDMFRIDAPKLAFVDTNTDWALVGLDSHVDGQDAGQIGEAQLDWLDDVLLSLAGRSIVLFVHHPPVPIGTGWLDAMGLSDADALCRVLRRHREVRAIFHGHTHQESHVKLDDIDVYGAPSTAFQFEPGTSAPRTEDIPPGYRVIDLEPDGVKTRVVRMPKLRHRPTSD